MQNEKPIRIAIVDDHTLFRNGVASLLSELTEIEVLCSMPQTVKK